MDLFPLPLLAITNKSVLLMFGYPRRSVTFWWSVAIDVEDLIGEGAIPPLFLTLRFFGTILLPW